jgi:hypothetical protein
MSLILIHPDYQNGSFLCPVCNVKKGNIRRDNLKLCFDCNKAAIEQNPKNERKQISRINYLVRGVSLMIYRMTIKIFDLGYNISYFFRIVKGSVYGQRWYSPDSHLINKVGQSSNGAGPDSTYLNKSGQRIYYIQCFRNS